MIDKLKVFSEKTGPKAWFIGTPCFSNIGDHAIAQGTIDWLEREFPDVPVMAIPMMVFLHAADKIAEYVKDGVILLQGGGNLGNVWPNEEAFRRQVVTMFPDRPIVVFPQSLFYTRDYAGAAAILESAEIYARHRNLTFYARDSVSASLMRDYFRLNMVYEVPDMAFQMNVPKWTGERVGIGVCMRDDHEKTEQNTNILQACQKLDPASKNISTRHYDDLDDTMRKPVIDAKLRAFAGMKMIVTDRLHGVIFAAITGTPCVALPSLTGKTENVISQYFMGKVGLLKHGADVMKAVESLYADLPEAGTFMLPVAGEWDTLRWKLETLFEEER